MASRPLHALLLAARDSLAGSSHWAYFAILALALVHALVVRPFIAGSELISETRLERARLAAVESGLGESRGALEAVRQEISSAVAPALERLIDDLGSDLERLDVTRRRIAAAAAEAAAAAATAAGTAPPAGAGTPQLPPAPAGESAVRPFVLDDPDRVADLREARTPDQLLAALTPLVEELITRPRYFDLERRWKDGALPRLEARLTAAAGAVPGLRSDFPAARDQWQALAGSLTALAGVARELRFDPPAPGWWFTATRDEIELGLTPEVAAEIRRPRRLAELESAAQRAVEITSEIVAKVAQAKRELGEPAAAFPWLDPGAVVMFPILLGLMLGGAITWRSQRLRELGLATRLALEHDGSPALPSWFRSQVQWSTAAGASAAAAWRACALQTLASYVLAMGWIALAAVQLQQLDPSGHRRLLVSTVAGASLVLVAVVHRLLVVRRAIMALDRGVAVGDSGHHPQAGIPVGEGRAGEPAAEDRPTGGDPDGDDELLGIRPLRR